MDAGAFSRMVERSHGRCSAIRAMSSVERRCGRRLYAARSAAKALALHEHARTELNLPPTLALHEQPRTELNLPPTLALHEQPRAVGPCMGTYKWCLHRVHAGDAYNGASRARRVGVGGGRPIDRFHFSESLEIRKTRKKKSKTTKREGGVTVSCS